jgi:hypothetical protein
MITERGGMRRIDEVKILGSYARLFAAGDTELEVEGRAGVGLYGDFGGARLQDWFHHNVVHGRFLGDTLQDQYPAGNDAVPLLGGLVSARRPLGGVLSVRAGVEGELALGGAGLSYVRPFVTLEADAKLVRLEAGDRATAYFTDNPYLKLPGGYRTGELVHSPFVRVTVPTRWFELGFEVRKDEGGSGQTMGEVMINIPLGRRR